MTYCQYRSSLFPYTTLFRSGRAPDHFHEYEEVLFILRGTGRMWTVDVSTPIGPGACVYLPRGQVHCVEDRKSTRLNSSHLVISYAVFCLKKKNKAQSSDSYE